MQGMIGEVRLFGGNFAPRQWAFCEGQLLAINQNQALFSILGTTYGGDGRTTFGLPDLRGRSVMGQGNGPGLSDRPLGQRSGTQFNNLNSNNLPSHTHAVASETITAAVPVSIDPGDENAPADAHLTQQTNEFYAGSATANQFYGNDDVTLNATLQVANQGASQSFNNLQPYLTCNYIICLTGIFPSRH